MKTLTRAQHREVDRLAIEELGIPGIVLMENAGRNATDIILELLDEIAEDHYFKGDEPRVAIVCGGGNNGGDGYVIARHLYNTGIEVAVFALKDPKELEGDAAVNANIAVKMQLDPVLLLDEGQLKEHESELAEADVIVDAMLGTGFTGQVRGHVSAAIHLCNALREDGATIVAIDVPSGLDCDTGKPADATIIADVTITFVASKTGFNKPGADRFVGRIFEADIGAPLELIERVQRM
ncbi:MAG: NAD(P)H-hydrate epimerase [Phycisphaeraceae bacterium]